MKSQTKKIMSRRGHCWNNAVKERVFRSYKSEWMASGLYNSFEEAKKDIMAYIKHYNYHRGHSYNSYLSLSEVEKAG